MVEKNLFPIESYVIQFLTSNNLKQETYLYKSSIYSLTTFKKPNNIRHYSNLKAIIFLLLLAINKLWTGSKRAVTSRHIWNMQFHQQFIVGWASSNEVITLQDFLCIIYVILCTKIRWGAEIKKPIWLLSIPWYRHPWYPSHFLYNTGHICNYSLSSSNVRVGELKKSLIQNEAIILSMR